MPLRSLSESDLPLILKWRNDLAIRMSMFSTNEITEEEHLAWFARLQASHTSLCYIYENEQGSPEGVVNFTELNEKNGSAFWGFYTSPTAKPGTGTKLGRDAMNEAFTVRGLRKLSAEVLENNSKSIKLHQRLGFNQEGFFRAHHLTSSGYVGVLRFGIISSEWLHTQRSVESYISSFEIK